MSSKIRIFLIIVIGLVLIITPTIFTVLDNGSSKGEVATGGTQDNSRNVKTTVGDTNVKGDNTLIEAIRIGKDFTVDSSYKNFYFNGVDADSNKRIKGITINTGRVTYTISDNNTSFDIMKKVNAALEKKMAYAVKVKDFNKTKDYCCGLVNALAVSLNSVESELYKIEKNDSVYNKRMTDRLNVLESLYKQEISGFNLFSGSCPKGWQEIMYIDTPLDLPMYIHFSKVIGDNYDIFSNSIEYGLVRYYPDSKYINGISTLPSLININMTLCYKHNK